MAKLNENQLAELGNLRDHILYIIEALDRAEPSPTWSQLRALVTSAAEKHSLRDMRAMMRELRAISAALPPAVDLQLREDFRERFGSEQDESDRREADAVRRIRARGAIRSEGEYRVVQAYADTIVADPAREAEYLDLAALLDDFSAAPGA